VKPATIEGIVTQLGRRALHDARVTLTGVSGKSAATNMKGQFTFADLAPGAYAEASATLFVRTEEQPESLTRPTSPRRQPSAHAGRGDHRPRYDQTGGRCRPRVEALRYQYRDGAKVFVLAGTGHSDVGRIPDLQSAAGCSPSRDALANPLQAALAPVDYPGMVDPQDSVPIAVAPGTESSAIDIPSRRTELSVRLEVAGTFPNAVARYRRARGRSLPG
jgi:hypothetical protein